jgi:hypothetical protein
LLTPVFNISICYSITTTHRLRRIAHFEEGLIRADYSPFDCFFPKRAISKNGFCVKLPFRFVKFIEISRRLMTTILQPHYEEKRFALRMALRLPVVVSGRTGDGAAWSEPTETDDISTTGALFQLNQKVSTGDNLYIRSHRPDGMAVEINATVVRIAPALHGTHRIGVAITEPVEGWLRLFVSWVADDQSIEEEV